MLVILYIFFSRLSQLMIVTWYPIFLYCYCISTIFLQYIARVIPLDSFVALAVQIMVSSWCLEDWCCSFYIIIINLLFCSCSIDRVIYIYIYIIVLGHVLSMFVPGELNRYVRMTKILWKHVCNENKNGTMKKSL